MFYKYVLEILLHIFSQKGLSKFIRKIFFCFDFFLSPFATLWHDKVFAWNSPFSVLQQVIPSKNGSKKCHFQAHSSPSKPHDMVSFLSLNHHILCLLCFLQQNYCLNVRRVLKPDAPERDSPLGVSLFCHANSFSFFLFSVWEEYSQKIPDTHFGNYFKTLPLVL